MTGCGSCGMLTGGGGIVLPLSGGRRRKFRKSGASMPHSKKKSSGKSSQKKSGKKSAKRSSSVRVLSNKTINSPKNKNVRLLK